MIPIPTLNKPSNRKERGNKKIWGMEQWKRRVRWLWPEEEAHFGCPEELSPWSVEINDFFFGRVFLKLTFVVEGSEDDIIWGIDFLRLFLHALNEEQIWCFPKLGEPRNTRFSSRIHGDCGWSPHFFSTNPKSSGFPNYTLQVEGSLFFCNPNSLWFRTNWSPSKLLKPKEIN